MCSVIKHLFGTAPKHRAMLLTLELLFCPFPKSLSVIISEVRPAAVPRRECSQNEWFSGHLLVALVDTWTTLRCLVCIFHKQNSGCVLPISWTALETRGEALFLFWSQCIQNIFRGLNLSEFEPLASKRVMWVQKGGVQLNLPKFKV